jgi:hypothetical protein
MALIVAGLAALLAPLLELVWLPFLWSLSLFLDGDRAEDDEDDNPPSLQRQIVASMAIHEAVGVFAACYWLTSAGALPCALAAAGASLGATIRVRRVVPHLGPGFTALWYWIPAARAAIPGAVAGMALGLLLDPCLKFILLVVAGR